MKALLRLILSGKPKKNKVNDLVPRGVMKTIIPKEYSDKFIFLDRHKFDESKIVELND